MSESEDDSQATPDSQSDAIRRERPFLQPLRAAHKASMSERERTRAVRRDRLAIHAAACEARMECVIARDKMRAVAAFVKANGDEPVAKRADEVLEHLTSMDYVLTEEIRGLE